MQRGRVAERTRVYSLVFDLLKVSKRGEERRGEKGGCKLVTIYRFVDFVGSGGRASIESPCTHSAYFACRNSWTISWWPSSGQGQSGIATGVDLILLAPAARRSRFHMAKARSAYQGGPPNVLALFTSAFTASNTHSRYHTSGPRLENDPLVLSLFG